VTLQTPDEINQPGHEILITGPTPNEPWRVVASTGYPAGTTFTVHVDNPDCKTSGSASTVVDNVPRCSNASDVGSSGLSTDHVSVSAN
jgi:hypothetical protein